MRPYHYTYILTVLDGIPDKEQRHECTEAVRLHWQAADFTAAGKPSEAIDLERRAISVFKRVSGTDGLIALSSANIGLAYGQIHRFKESIVACQSAISFLEQSPQLTNELATCLHTIGCSLLGLGEATDSLPYLKRAVKIWSVDQNWSSLESKEQKISDAKANIAHARRVADQQTGRSWFQRIFGAL